MKMNRIKWKSALLGMLWISITAVSLSQSLKSGTDITEKKDQDKIQVPTFTVSTPALEGPVDPNKYYVGPSDVLSVNIWTSPPLSFFLTVTPEGTLIIPTVGEINVTDLSLANAKKKIIAEIKKKYLTGDPTVTLISPRQVTVTITGAVRYPGKYELNATDRVDKAVAMANKIRKDEPPESEELWQLKLYERNQSKRNIRLTRRTGEKLRTDILRYYATKDDQWNPTLREGDEIFVPRIDPKKNVFGVYSGVNVQGSFELIKGDSLLDAIELAYGFTIRAIKDSIVHYRYDVKNGRQIITVYDFNQIRQGSQKNIELIPGDRIVVKEQPDIREDYRVFVEGEVQYPGFCPITKESTRLSKVIGWAGGFTEYASLNAAELIRSAVPPSEQRLERILSLRGSVTPEDSAYYVLESELRMTREVVSVNFTKLFVARDSSEDVFLQNGDWINIPSVRMTIYVFGQVMSPGNVPFITGKDYRYYIEKTGGFTEKARTGDVMIIKRSTRQWLSPKETTIEEGDNIWVPKEPERSFAYYMNIVGQTASIISVAVSIVLLTIQMNK